MGMLTRNDDNGTDRGFSCGLSVVFQLQNVLNNENTGTSDLQQTHTHTKQELVDDRTDNSKSCKNVLLNT